MSFFESITKKSKLKAAIKQSTEARNSDGYMADQLYRKVYQDYAEVVANEPLIAEALYNWGLALLHQARTKSGETAAEIYLDAIAKFSFCLTIEQAYLAAALDGGVAFMELARIKGANPSDALYAKAQSYFEKANSIQAGAGSYNLACIYGLRGEKEACLNALEISRNKGYLPVIADIMADPDLDGVKQLAWFTDFIESLDKQPAVVEESNNASVESQPQETKAEAVAVAEEVSQEPAVAETQEASPSEEQIEAVADSGNAEEAAAK